MRKDLVFSAFVISMLASLVPSSSAVEKRCGWLENPTPSNWWLNDRDGSWGISFQGGYQADGMDHIPDLDRSEYVETNIHYGYACACMDMTTDPETMRVITIFDFEQLPLATCREDPALPTEAMRESRSQGFQ